MTERKLNKPHKEKSEANTYSLFTLTSYLSNGGVAQLGEHLPCKQGVMGSIPIISTMKIPSEFSLIHSSLFTIHLVSVEGEDKNG